MNIWGALSRNVSSLSTHDRLRTSLLQNFLKVIPVIPLGLRRNLIIVPDIMVAMAVLHNILVFLGKVCIFQQDPEAWNFHRDQKFCALLRIISSSSLQANTRWQYRYEKNVTTVIYNIVLNCCKDE